MSTAELAKKSGHAVALLPANYAPALVRSQTQVDALIEANPPTDCRFWDCFAKSDVLIERDGKLAIITIPGAMAFNFDIWSYCMGDVPMKQVCAAMNEVAADPSFEHVLVSMNCPGGSVFGTTDLRSACDALASSGKSVSVLAHEQMTSGGYLAACRLTKGNQGRIYATPTAIVGSIGCVIMMYDTSKMYEGMGVKVIPITTGKLKAAGADGTPITAEQIAVYQSFADDVMVSFAQDVADARGLSLDEIYALEAGYFGGQDLLDKKLVDELVDAGELTASLRKKYGVNAVAEPVVVTPADGEEVDDTQPGEQPTGECMAGEKSEVNTKVPATLAELKGIFGDDSGAVLKSIEAGHTVQEAQTAQITALKAQLTANNESKVAAETEAAKKAAQNSKLPPASQTAAIPNAGNSLQLSAGGPTKVRPGDDHPFMQAVQQHAATAKISLGEAVIAVSKAQPELHADYKEKLPKGDLLKNRRTA